MGLPILSEGITCVETEGTAEGGIKVNVFLGTGQGVRCFLEEFNAKGREQLVNSVSRVNWEDTVPTGG